MTPQQARDQLAAKRTDAPTPFALISTDQLLGELRDAWFKAAHHAAHHSDGCPPEVTERVLQALKDEGACRGN